MSVLRMSRYLDPVTGYVMYGEIMIPAEAFNTGGIYKDFCLFDCMYNF